MQPLKHSISIQAGGQHNEEEDIRRLELDGGDLILDIDDRRYRFDVYRDGHLGIHLMNDVDLKITTPPAFSYPSPYVILG